MGPGFESLEVHQKKALAFASAFFNEAHLAVHEASCEATHEAGLCPMKRAFGTRRSRVRFASCECNERIMATQLPLHICEANASLNYRLCAGELTAARFCAIITPKKAAS